MSEPTPLELGELGLAEAFDRLRGRVGTQADPGSVLVSLGETLEWLYALEELHKGATFYAARIGDPAGETEGGLIYARGLLTHGLASLAALVTFPWPTVFGMGSGGGSRIISPPSATEYRWKSFVDLPPPRKDDKHHRDRMYQDRVQGQPVLPPLATAKAYLEGLP
jgi:hypothetical protein